MKVENMDPRVVAYLAQILIPIGITVGGWAIGCVKTGVHQLKVNHEVKKLRKHIDKDYEELCRLMEEA